MPAVPPPSYRTGEIKWTQGAHKRGVRQDNRVLIRLPSGLITPGRWGDHSLAPQKVKKLQQMLEEKRTRKQKHRLEDVLNRQTQEGALLLKHRDWPAIQVKESTLTEEFKAKLKDPFEEIPKDEIAFCRRILLEIRGGRLSSFPLMRRNPRLSPRDIISLIIYPEVFAYFYQIFRNKSKDGGRIIEEELRTPKILSLTLKDMGIAIHISPLVMDESPAHSDLSYILKKIRPVIFRLQQIADKSTKSENCVAVRFYAINLKAEVNPFTLRIIRLWVGSVQEPVDYPISVMTKEDFMVDFNFR